VDGTAKECTYGKPDASKTFLVDGTSYKIACKATVCEAALAQTAIKRQKVLENGDCEECPAK